MPTPRKGETHEQMLERRRKREAPKKPAAATPAVYIIEPDFNRGRWTESTRELYALCWRNFDRYCKARELKALPAEPQTVADFLLEWAKTHKTAGVNGHLAAIAATHALYDFNLPVKGTEIADARADVRRRLGSRGQPKKALTADQVRKIAAKFPATIRGSRDRAIFLFTTLSAMRRSEIASLNVGDLTFSSDGVLVLLRHSKTDKTSKGQKIDVPRTKTALCPVAAVEKWIADRGLTDGPLFLTERDTRIPGHAVADVFKAGAESIGLDPRLYAGHTGRRTYITLAFQGGAKLEEIMKKSRHTTYDIARGYIEELDVFTNPADAAVGL
jgi:integrase